MMSTPSNFATGQRVLVIGCGSIGRRHLRNLHALGAGELASYDVDPSQHPAADAAQGVVVVHRLEEAWDWQPSIAVIATPTDSHVRLALEAVQRGCHIFIEKPLSFSAAHVDALCDEIQCRGSISMVGCNMRFHFGPRTVHEWLLRDTIGKVLSARIQCGSCLPTWRPESDYRQSYSAHPQWGGAILDCIHEIDLALWHFGPAQVAAAVHVPATTIGLDTDGLAEIILRHDSGVISSIHLNFVQRDYRRCCQIIGTEGTIYWDLEHGAVIQYGADGEECRRVEAPVEDTIDRMYVDQLAHFLTAIAHCRPAMNSAVEASQTLALALEARRRGTLQTSVRPTAQQLSEDHALC